MRRSGDQLSACSFPMNGSGVLGIVFPTLGPNMTLKPTEFISSEVAIRRAFTDAGVEFIGDDCVRYRTDEVQK